MSLLDVYKRICEISDPVASALRIAGAAKSGADDLEEEVLTTGAMRRDFQIVLKIKSSSGGFRMIPVLY